MFEQERTLNRLQQRISSESGLLAACLLGSFGRRQNDEWSDIDLMLVYPSSAGKEAARPRWEEMASAILPFVRSYVVVDPADPDHLIALYANGSKFDLYFKAQEEVQPHPRYQALRILKDSNGWAAALMAQSARLSQTGPTGLSEQELEALDRRFWVDLWELYRLTGRGEIDRPFVIYAGLLADVIRPLVEALPAGIPAVQQLTTADFRRAPEANLAMVRMLVTHYQSARSELIQRYRLVYQPDRAVESELVRKIF